MARSAAGPRREPAGYHPEPRDLGGRPAPSPAGTRRRLQALAARSWSPAAVERETGIPARLIQRELDGYDDLPPRLAGAVAAAYDRLWDQHPPAATAAEREAAAETFARARRSGWAPPMAWDDDLIDLPGTRPALGWKPSEATRRKARDIVEDAEFVREHGGLRDASNGQIAIRLGIKRDRLDQAYSRARRYAARSTGRPAADAEREAEAG
jgi:hypothetical protein